jgi:isoleucyl-tRNA synthetase
MAENKSEIAKREEETLKFWQENKIFEKSVAKDAPRGNFVFYDGPPFATGEPHFGHVLPTTIKDIIPRFKTMQGFRVERKWGWDCHGLPIENLIEKELGFNSKREIEEYGIDKFNKAARDSVLRYADVWKRIIPRLGRWVDMENDYRTMDSTYTESVWWSFKKLHEKNRIYESFKSMQICPRCGTPLSNFEVNQGYKDVTDISVYAKFELVDEPRTFLLAWTTTPWTLPGNVALAISPNIQYVKVKSENTTYILARERVEHTFKDRAHEIIGEVSAKELIGKSYKPLFPYYKDAKLRTILGKPADNNLGWKIYAADFVTTEEGTGIVHIAPAFGEEDFELAKRENLPFVQHIRLDGTFKDEVTDFANQLAKPKEDPQRTDVEIIKYLAAKNTLFAKEKIIHSYPHCWRCDTPLLNYATSSWFVSVTAFKHILVKQNQKIHWVPESIGKNRFGDWLEGARDWAVSRSRYWGAPIPVWRCQKCHKIEVLGSIADIQNKTRRNNYFLMRHGQAENNITNILSSSPDNTHHLTEEGKKAVATSAVALRNKNIDVIIHSPFLRTSETAKIVKDVIKFKGETLTDIRLFEMNFGDLNGKPVEEYHHYYSLPEEELNTPLPNGESINDVKRRLGRFLYEIDKRYENKNILIITHDAPTAVLFSSAIGADDKKVMDIWGAAGDFLNPGQVIKVSFGAIPHNENYELDFHRPYIDQISWKCDCGGEFRRVPEVFDVWYESGSMPYGKIHYPFNSHSVIKTKSWFSAKEKPVEFPADFIAEGLDQTRGWFYSLLVLNYELFEETPYKNVVVNGLILAEDGRKMAKRLKNYPDLSETLNKFSADALRYFLITSPASRAEEVRFSEKGLDEVTKKIINRLQNVLSFYELYKKAEIEGHRVQGENILDQWILARLNQLNYQITTNLEKYELDKAARPINDFVDDLSTWYLQRSRERFRGEDENDKQRALHTLRAVLLESAKLLAPFMPFLAEDIYQKVKKGAWKESVHLENWSPHRDISRDDEIVLRQMSEARHHTSIGLKDRAKAGIAVRQPLLEIKIRGEKPREEIIGVTGAAINVGKVVYDKNLARASVLSLGITPELEEKGQVRELIRAIQNLRKEEGLQIGEIVTLANSTTAAGQALVNKFESEIRKTAGISRIHFENNNGKEVRVGNLVFKIQIKK